MNGPTRNSLPPPPPEAMTGSVEGNVINDASLSIIGEKASSWENIGLYCADLTALGPYCQDLSPIFQMMALALD